MLFVCARACLLKGRKGAKGGKMAEWNEFLHFEFNDFSSTTINSNNKMFYRVSNGSRFNENMLPSMADTTVDVPGNHG
jgi:hypothetical protein